MKNLLCHIISFGILTPSFSDKVINQSSKLLTTEWTFNRDIFIGYDRSNKRLDDFYFRDINITKYPDLAFVVKLVLTLSHGQASVERGFSVDKAIITNNPRPHNAQITSNLKVAYKSARQKYLLALKEERLRRRNRQ